MVGHQDPGGFLHSSEHKAAVAGRGSCEFPAVCRGFQLYISIIAVILTAALQNRPVLSLKVSDGQRWGENTAGLKPCACSRCKSSTSGIPNHSSFSFIYTLLFPRGSRWLKIPRLKTYHAQQNPINLSFPEKMPAA